MPFSDVFGAIKEVVMDRFWAITVALEADVSVAFFETKEMFI